jgi:hypothetical protein
MEKPIVTADEVFAVNRKIRWVAMASDGGDVLMNQMRPGMESYSPTDVDREFVMLGPLTIIGVCEKYSEYLKGVEYVVVWFGLAVCVYARLGAQILAVSIEKDREAILAFEEWLERKQKEITASIQKR